MILWRSVLQEIYDAIIVRTLEGLIRAATAQINDAVPGERLRAKLAITLMRTRYLACL